MIFASGLLSAREPNANLHLESVAFEPGGKVLGGAFSPDSKSLAIVVHLKNSETQFVLRTIDLTSMVPSAVTASFSERVELSASVHLLQYSFDGRYLLLATRGSDEIEIVEAATLHPIKRVLLHPQLDARTTNGFGHRHFFGVVSMLATSPNRNLFALLTHDELRGDEVFVGSFSSNEIVSTWPLGTRRAETSLGQVSLAFGAHGSDLFVCFCCPGGG